MAAQKVQYPAGFEPDPEPQAAVPEGSEPDGFVPDKPADKPSVMITPDAPAPDKGTVSVEQARAAFSKNRGPVVDPIFSTVGPEARDMIESQRANVKEGVSEVVHHPIDTVIAPAAGMVWDAAMGRWSKIGSEVTGAGKALLGPPARGAIGVGASYAGIPYSNAPTNEEWAAHAKLTGTNAASIAAGEAIAGGVQALPKVPPILRGIIDTVKEKIPEIDLRTKPQTLITRGLTPTDKTFQSYVDAGLSELKASQKEVGTIKDVPTAQRGLDGRWQTYDAKIKEMVKPREHQVVHGSAQEMIDRQIAAIPDDWKLHNPQDYQKLVDQLRKAHPHDYTVGELNQVRSDLGKANSAYYGKDIQGQLTMDVGSKAVQMARETAARDLFYKGMDNFGEGAPVRELNSRVGAILHLQDELWDNLNKSISERRPFVQRNITRPVRTAMGADFKGVDEHLAAAVKRWDKLPQKVQKTLATTTGVQHDLLSTGGPGMFGGPGGAGGAEPGVFSDATRTAEYNRLQRQRELWGKPPEGQGTPAGAGVDNLPGEVLPHGGPGMLSGPQGTEPSAFSHATAEKVFERTQRQRNLWYKGEAQAPTDLPRTQGQLSLERGMAPTVMGLDQTSLGRAAASLNEGELIDVIDHYAKQNAGYDETTGRTSGFTRAQRTTNGAKLWEDMTNAERQHEFLTTVRQDLKNAVKEAGRDQEGYVKGRADNPADPMAGVYKILYRRMREGGQLPGKGTYMDVGTSRNAPKFGDISKVPGELTKEELTAAYNSRPAAYHAETPEEFIQRISKPKGKPPAPPKRSK